MHGIWKMKKIVAGGFLIFMIMGTIWMTVEMFNELKKPVVHGHKVKAA